MSLSLFQICRKKKIVPNVLLHPSSQRSRLDNSIPECPSSTKLGYYIQISRGKLFMQSRQIWTNFGSVFELLRLDGNCSGQTSSDLLSAHLLFLDFSKIEVDGICCLGGQFGVLYTTGEIIAEVTKV